MTETTVSEYGCSLMEYSSTCLFFLVMLERSQPAVGNFHLEKGENITK